MVKIRTLHIIVLCALVAISTSSSRCVILHMSVITQRGDTALMEAARGGKSEAIVELVKAGANVEMLNRVCQNVTYTHVHVYTDVYYVYIVTISHTSSRCVMLHMCLSSHSGESLP